MDDALESYTLKEIESVMKLLPHWTHLQTYSPTIKGVALGTHRITWVKQKKCDKSLTRQKAGTMESRHEKKYMCMDISSTAYVASCMSFHDMQKVPS